MRTQKVFNAAPHFYDNDIEKARQYVIDAASRRGARQIAEDLGRLEEYDDLYSKMSQQSNGIAMMPFIHNTEAWTDRSIKHELDKAFDNGSDYFSWSPGDVHVERYDLSKHIDEVRYDPVSGLFEAYTPDGDRVVSEIVQNQDKLDDYLGKEVADRYRAKIAADMDKLKSDYPVRKEGHYWFLRNGPDENSLIVDSRDFGSLADYSASNGGFTSLDAAESAQKQMMAEHLRYSPIPMGGLDLRHGGEGMRKYYEMYGKRVQKVLEKATGMKVPIEEITVQTADGPRKQFGIRLTDEMREKARFSDFAKGGAVTGFENRATSPAVSRALALTSEF